jgi:formate hydrogenlyase subunit 3/multisubunit Na+/H+ antiporter MnhD subunit
MLLSILYIYNIFGTLDYENLQNVNFSKLEEQILWLTFFVSFASKIPMFPFHIWLPEAHVEAPTVGSVLLAGILLKLGVFGFLRFSLVLFPLASVFFSPAIYVLSILGVVFASLAAVRQTDMKRIIAYSSVAHMNMVTLGIFSFNVIGIDGAVLQSLSHGFVSGGMFLLIGILYSRYHSRFLYYYGGLVQTMPIFSALFLLFTFANIALPGTSSFVGEFLLLLGIFKTNVFAAIISAVGVILCGSYSLWMYNRIVFGNLKIDYTLIFNDTSKKEFFCLLPLLIFFLVLGVFPSIFTNSFTGSTAFNTAYCDWWGLVPPLAYVTAAGAALAFPPAGAYAFIAVAAVLGVGDPAGITEVVVPLTDVSVESTVPGKDWRWWGFHDFSDLVAASLVRGEADFTFLFSSIFFHPWVQSKFFWSLAWPAGPGILIACYGLFNMHTLQPEIPIMTTEKLSQAVDTASSIC